MKWEYIDFEKKLLTIPREQMKLKNPNFDDFKMPLSDEVISILEEQKRELEFYTNKLDYVFLGVDNNTHINKESPNKALKIMEFNNEKEGKKIRLHGFRGTFRSMIDTLDTNNLFSYETKERALDHHDKNRVVRAYSHKGDYIEQLRELMNFWSNFINSLIKKDEV
jgi:integrase